ncbi:MAG: hypothetical protein HY241_07530 [Actinobacteria bacterium]|nr:hypothetical protein [Actinomycetota bacterium]
MIFTKARAVAATVVLAGGVTVLAPAAPALAYISPPLVLLGEAQSPAYLVAKGAAADVTVEYTCSADSMYIDLQLTERVGKKIASGWGYTSVGCNATTQRTVIRVNANPYGAAFAKGTAVADTYVWGCRFTGEQYFCGSDHVSQTISLK